MPELFLHAGSPKTGTSFLQVLFARYANELGASGTVYPKGHLFDQAKAGEITSGNGVEMANYIRPNLPHRIADKDAFIGTFDRDLKTAGDKNVLYSSEFLMFPAGERTANIARKAEENGFRVRVIYLVRDIGEAAFSAYFQEIKRNCEVRSFLDFLKSWNPHYLVSIKGACDAFGSDSLIVFNYEEHGHRLAELFFRDILNADFVPQEREVINRSLSLKEADLLRLMNTAFPKKAPEFSTFVSDALMAVEREREPRSLTREESEFLDERFRGLVDYVNGFVRGRPIAVSTSIVDERPANTITDFERAMVAIVAKLVIETLK
jgi:hypothetical protein